MLRNIGKVVIFITAMAVIGGTFTANASPFANTADGWAIATQEAKQALEALKAAR